MSLELPVPESAEDELRLRASLIHRGDSPEPTHVTCALPRLQFHAVRLHGTAEQRPKKGLLYDAPLGLKF